MSQFVAGDINQTILDVFFWDTLYCKNDIVIPNCKNDNVIPYCKTNIIIPNCKNNIVIQNFKKENDILDS